MSKEKEEELDGNTPITVTAKGHAMLLWHDRFERERGQEPDAVDGFSAGWDLGFMHALKCPKCTPICGTKPS